MECLVFSALLKHGLSIMSLILSLDELELELCGQNLPSMLSRGENMGWGFGAQGPTQGGPPRNDHLRERIGKNSLCVYV